MVGAGKRSYGQNCHFTSWLTGLACAQSSHCTATAPFMFLEIGKTIYTGLYIPTTETLALTVLLHTESHGHEDTAGLTWRRIDSVTYTTFFCYQFTSFLGSFLARRKVGKRLRETVFYILNGFQVQRQFSHFSLVSKVTSYLTQVPPLRQGRCWQTGGSQFLMFLPLTASPTR